MREKSMDETSPKRQSTLRLTWPLGQTPALTLLILFILLGSAEWTARQAVIQEYLPPPALTNVPRRLQLQLNRLEVQAEREGQLDCVILGAGPAYRGIEPDTFEQAYRAQTGHNVRCFNLAGISGWNETFTRLVAEVLIERYRPGLLIITTDALLASQDENPTLDRLAAEFAAAPWVEQQLGHVTTAGWLSSHSQAYGTYERLRQDLKRPGAAAASYLYLDEAVSATGRLLPDKAPDGGMQSLMPPTEVELLVYRPLFNWKVAHDSLDTVLRLSDEVPVVIVEMPLHPNFLYFFDDEAEGYERMITTIETAAEQKDVPFWRTQPQELIPEDGWLWRPYLNEIGVQAFSHWLGEQVGRAVNQGELENPAPGDGSEGL